MALPSPPTIEQATEDGLLRTRAMFQAEYGAPVQGERSAQQSRMFYKVAAEYGDVKDVPPPTGAAGKALRDIATILEGKAISKKKKKKKKKKSEPREEEEVQPPVQPIAPAMVFPKGAVRPEESEDSQSMGDALAQLPAAGELRKQKRARGEDVTAGALVAYKGDVQSMPGAGALSIHRLRAQAPKAEWHAPWKLMRVISGHTGWVRCVTTSPANDMFATGSFDRSIKIWDMASGILKLTLTGHISTVRGLAISDRHPYLFSCGEDKMVRCWDLEANRIIRAYHGHLSGVYTLSLHPTLDVLVTAGRDATVRVWDMRTKGQIHVLAGHEHTVGALLTQATDPQIISGSQDTTIRLWDMVAGKTMAQLTNHKKGVRALVASKTKHVFASGAADNIKQWRAGTGKFIQNLSGHNAIVNCLAANQDDVLVSGGDNGSIRFWDWGSGHCFQEEETLVQPGSLESEAGIFCMTFDQTGSRLIMGEADKTIKMYKEDPDATPETHPVQQTAQTVRKRF